MSAASLAVETNSLDCLRVVHRVVPDEQHYPTALFENYNLE